MKCVDCSLHRCDLFLPDDQPLQVKLICYGVGGKGRTLPMEPHKDMKTIDAPAWCPLMQKEPVHPAPSASIASSAAPQDRSVDERR